jgi:hypothetical protein
VRRCVHAGLAPETDTCFKGVSYGRPVNEQDVFNSDTSDMNECTSVRLELFVMELPLSQKISSFQFNGFLRYHLSHGSILLSGYYLPHSVFL